MKFEVYCDESRRVSTKKIDSMSIKSSMMTQTKKASDKTGAILGGGMRETSPRCSHDLSE
ncbi:MAG: hypothetical protein AUK35_06270 [Zetaproteobacteria bacterium CG2_30_46_52]|nr:MAG: hypothetical protein AUK35_06270 [Zetaproteobacteria bacterium CG2_30_46_52]